MSPILLSAENPAVASLVQAYLPLESLWPESRWLKSVSAQAQQVLSTHVHGDLPRWSEAVAALPETRQEMDADHAAPRLGGQVEDLAVLRDALMQLHPWRKGPLQLGGLMIDTEWRSDWKWTRLKPHVDLQGRRVLDIGCGNGYFGWRMLAAGAQLVVGVDPTLVFVMQWLACQHFAGPSGNFVLPLGIEDLPPGAAEFDTVFSMGVLYHRRDPVQHLQQIRDLLRDDGDLVLETLVLPDGSQGPVLVPESRYARMRNVWAIPAPATLLEWLSEAGFRKAQLLDVTTTTTQEQRSTDWMRFESLGEALHPQDAGQTLEGYPAPTRALLVARK